MDSQEDDFTQQEGYTPASDLGGTVQVASDAAALKQVGVPVTRCEHAADERHAGSPYREHCEGAAIIHLGAAADKASSYRRL